MRRMENDIGFWMNLAPNDPPVDPDISPTPPMTTNDDLDELVTFLMGDRPPGTYDDIIDFDFSL